MIIPIYKSHTYKEGDIILSLKSIHYEYCTFTENHEFIIKHIKTNSEIDNIIIDKEMGIELKVPNFNDFTLKCDLEIAKKRSIYLNNYYYTKKFILKNCPYKSYSYDEYVRYDSCNLKKGNDDMCSVDIDECIKHIPKDTIQKNGRIVSILRNKKINKIKNVL